MNKEKMINVLQLIAEDMKNDAAAFDGQRFTGKTVGTYFGNQGAAIASLANIMQTILTGGQMSETVKRYNHVCPHCDGFGYTEKESVIGQFVTYTDYQLALATATALLDKRTGELAQLMKDADKFEDGIDWIQRAMRAEAKLDNNICNSGHETLPLTLWDCPECHNETKRLLEDANRKVAYFESLCIPITENMVRELQELVNGVDIGDLNEPLPNDEDDGRPDVPPPPPVKPYG